MHMEKQGGHVNLMYWAEQDAKALAEAGSADAAPVAALLSSHADSNPEHADTDPDKVFALIDDSLAKPKTDLACDGDSLYLTIMR